MAVYEIKKMIAIGEIGEIEELLTELEEQRLMVLEDKPTATAWIAGYFDSPEEATQVWERFAEISGANWSKGSPDLRELPDVDWKDSYKAHFKASKFGRLHWVPVWEKNTFVLPTGEEVLWLDPGMAFGTGNHETTRLCCERLAQHVEEFGNTGKVIDAGCGSGILALSAARLGFREIVGFDNDPEAIRVSKENAALNGLRESVKFYIGDLESGLMDRKADLVLANIQADVLIRFARELCGAVAPGGKLVLSGILSKELEQVRGKFKEIVPAWTMDVRVMGEWSDLTLVS